MTKNLIKSSLLAAAIAACALASLPASAHGYRGQGPRVSFGFAFGAPFYYGPRYYAPSPYYAPYYPYPVYPAVAAPYAPPAPTVYIERESASGAFVPARPAGYWYYCPEAQAYYPYVQQCSSEWQQVAPQPAS